MLKILFYSLGVLFAYFKHKQFYEISNVINLSEQIKKDALNNYNKSQAKATIKFSEISPEYKSLLQNLIVSILFFVWLIVGLTTFNWIFFLFFLLFEMFVINLLIKIFKTNVNFKIKIIKFHSIICWLLCIFVLLNTYYFNISSESVVQFLKK